MILRGLAQKFLMTFLVLSQVAPISVWGATASLGTARGIRTVELSLDGGKTWLPLGARSLPVLDGAQLRSTTGSAALELSDGSRINVLPFSSVRFQETEGATRISLLYGRLTFRLPAGAGARIVTPSARLEPVRQEVTVGEVFVAQGGIVGSKMTQGTLQLQELAGEKRVMLASLEPVFLPKRPVGSGPLFSSEPSPAPSVGAKGIFTPRGESIGYLQPDGQLVIEPGFTADLTRPFSPRLIRLAMAAIPEKDRTDDAMPLFNVNGGYVGYLAGPVFYAQAQAAPAAAQAAEAAAGVTPAAAAFGTVAAAGVGRGIAGAAGAFNAGGGPPAGVPPGPPATPVGPPAVIPPPGPPVTPPTP